MRKTQWIKTVIVCMASLLLVVMAGIYIIDPFFQFRVKDKTYIISPQYCASGLIKNYGYNTIIIGSSMTQNFDMDQFRDIFNCEPLHIGIGGMNCQEQMRYIELANDVNKARSYYIEIGLSSFAKEEDCKVTEYLARDDILSRCQYALSYEAWTRFIPIDMALIGLKILGKPLPEDYEYKTGIDYFGYWGHQYEYSKDVVIAGYKSNKYSVSSVDTNNLVNRMRTKIDEFVNNIDIDNAEYVFFFPPYSSLFWSDAQDKGYFYEYLEAKQYFIEKILNKGGIVYDFQSDELTMDLDNYKDTTHYSPKINDWMVDCFGSEKYLVNQKNRMELQQRLIDNTYSFRRDNSHIFLEN